MRTRKNKIMIAMCIAVLFMATGYAILASQLNIRGVSKLTDSWGVRITSVTSNAVGRAYNIADPTYTDTSMTFKVGVKEPGDMVTFNVTVQNFGTLDAILDEINATATGNEEIKYTISGIQEGTRLLAGETKIFSIQTRFDINATKLPTDPVKDLVVELVYIQDDGQTLTPSNPNIDEDYTYGGLANVVLTNNTAKADTSLNFTKTSYYINSYSVRIPKNPTKKTFTSSTKYYFGTSYTFDSTTGNYKLAGSITSGKWSAMSSSFKSYPYTCGYTSSTSTCTSLYKMTDYIDSTTGLSLLYYNTANYVDNGSGLFYTKTNTENNKPTYYFRGMVNNNYVKFGKYEEDFVVYRGYYSSTSLSDYFDYLYASDCTSASSYNYGCVATTLAHAGDDILWRIVRVNEDGSVRLISEDPVGMSRYNSSNTDNAYVGYMYGTAGVNSYVGTHDNANNSSIKNFLDNWYTKTLKNNYGKYMADAGFCNDRSVASASGLWNSFDTALGYGTNITYYGTYNRAFILKKPQFKCPQSNDLFTLTTGTKGNNALTYPVGLMAWDEAMYAGVTTGYSNLVYHSSYLLHDLPDGFTSYGYYSFWTMSPYYVYSSTNTSTGVTNVSPYIFMVSENGNSTVNVINPYAVRPVVNVKGSVGVASGIGTSDDPYILDVE